MPVLPSLDAVPFDQDLRNRHLIYYYNVSQSETDSGKKEKWGYEMWFHSPDRIVYAIHGGPMAGRYNFQTATYQCIRPGELWQCNWLEETGTICSLVFDIPNKKITTLLGFSKGHWTQPADSHGDKRNAQDFERWRGLAKVGIQTERHLLSEQADIVEDFHGAGALQDIDPTWPTL